MSVVSNRPITLRKSFSFYVPASQPETLEAVSSLVDAVTVCGPRGPEVIKSLRRQGWNTPVIFDRAGYRHQGEPIETNRWFEDQWSAGADRLLTPGSWVDWDSEGGSLVEAIKIETSGSHPDATVVLAVDHRWLTRAPMDLADSSTAGVFHGFYLSRNNGSSIARSTCV
jgi:hypothetical protein